MTHPSTVADTLDAAADLLSKPGAWTQGEIRRDLAGEYVSVWSGKATCWCTVGATLEVASFSASMEADRAFARWLGLDGIGALEKWNDAPERTQTEVVSKLHEAAGSIRGEVQP